MILAFISVNNMRSHNAHTHTHIDCTFM